MHKFLGGDAEKAVIYRSENLFSKEKLYIHFFADAPHLIKTVLNCLSNSGSGHCTRFMWNSGFFVLWSHISTLYYQDLECGLKMLNKLTSDHINLTPFSVMRVRLAAEVLSETVGTSVLGITVFETRNSPTYPQKKLIVHKIGHV